MKECIPNGGSNINDSEGMIYIKRLTNHDLNHYFIQISLLMVICDFDLNQFLNDFDFS